jgi:hypothetical protein
MRYLKRLVWSAMVAGAVGLTATPSFGQTAGGLGGGATGGLGGGGTAGGLGGGTTGGLGGGSGSSLSGNTTGTALQTQTTPPTLNPPTGTSTGVLSSTNFLAGYYAAPYYQGVLTNAKQNVAPGGFGSATFGNSTGGGNIGYAGGAAAGGRGGAVGGANGANNANNQTGGIVIPLQVQMSARTFARFPVSQVPTPTLQTEVSGLLARSVSTIPGAANVQVITVGDMVTLRGTVSDLEEARLIEGMTRLTPGVHAVRNELTFPVANVPR